MLTAAELCATLVFRKARGLATFDSLDTFLLMILHKMLIVVLAWQFGIVIFIMVFLLWLAWKYMRQVALLVSWPWVLTYSVVIVALTEIIYNMTKSIDPDIPKHIEVLPPEFVLGAILKIPAGSNPHSDDANQEGPERSVEQKVSTISYAIFMFLVELSVTLVFGHF